MSNISIENWQQVVPRELWREFALEEAHATADQVRMVLNNPGNDTILGKAMQARTDFLLKWLEEHEVDLSIRNMVPYGIAQDMAFRVQLINELTETACQKLNELDESTRQT